MKRHYRITVEDVFRMKTDKNIWALLAKYTFWIVGIKKVETLRRYEIDVLLTIKFQTYRIVTKFKKHKNIYIKHEIKLCDHWCVLISTYLLKFKDRNIQIQRINLNIIEMLYLDLLFIYYIIWHHYTRLISLSDVL